MSYLDFENKLCQRIVEICKGNIPRSELVIQIKLSMNKLNSSFDYDAYNNCDEERKFLQKAVDDNGPFLNAIPEAELTCKWFETKTDYASALAYNRPNEKKDKPFHVDIKYGNNLLEIKYPKNSNKYPVFQSNSSNMISNVPLKASWKAPFLNNATNLYITDYQEGAMLVDFIRLLNAKKHNKDIENLYFTAFFKRDEICGSQDEFQERIGKFISFYLKNSFEFTLTRYGKKVDIWDDKQPKAIYFFDDNNNPCEFDPQDPNFKCLHWGDNLVAFLLKLVPAETNSTGVACYDVSDDKKK